MTSGDYTICKALVGGDPVYTLTEGDERVVTGTREACEAEAHRRFNSTTRLSK